MNQINNIFINTAYTSIINAIDPMKSPSTADWFVRCNPTGISGLYISKNEGCPVIYLELNSIKHLDPYSFKKQGDRFLKSFYLRDNKGILKIRGRVGDIELGFEHLIESHLCDLRYSTELRYALNKYTEEVNGLIINILNTTPIVLASELR